MITVAVVDDQALIRTSIRMLVDATSDMEFCGSADDGRAAVSLARELTPNVILMDLNMPGVGGIHATQEIVRSTSNTRVLILTTFDDDENLVGAMKAGAAGFITKDSSPAQILSAIRQAHEGTLPLSTNIAKRLIGMAEESLHYSNEASKYTAREREILPLIAKGLTNAEIGSLLNISASTAKSHIGNMMAKSNCSTRTELAVIASRLPRTI